jgi:hypothetical protein
MQDYLFAERTAWSFTYELRDTGQFGFILPASQIIPCATEILAGAMELASADVERRLLLETTALVRGQSATLTSWRGSPGATTYFAYTFDGYGSTPIPQLNITLNLTQPVLIGAAAADGEGTARLTRRVPAGAPAIDILLQCAQRDRRSGVAERTIE